MRGYIFISTKSKTGVGIVPGPVTNNEPEPRSPSFAEALRFWWKLGWVTFGGTAAHLAIMHEELVERKQWIENDTFLNALSHCMSLPGPEATQLAIFLGRKLHGVRGGLFAGLLFFLPSMFIILGFSLLYVQFGSLPSTAAILSGLRPAVLALILVALLKLGKTTMKGGLSILVTTASVVAMSAFQVSVPTVMFAALTLGVLIEIVRRGQAPGSLDNAHKLIQRDTRQPRVSLRGFRSAALTVAISAVLWTLPLAVLYFHSSEFPFWATLILFFTKAAFVTVGGSYTVLPYIAQSAVVKLHWLSNLNMADGFALAESTPGPLIIVVAYVGFMAGYHHFHQSLWLASLALLLTTFYTFLPCFFFVFLGAPIVDKVADNLAVKRIMRLVTAVVTAAIANLAFYLAKPALFTAPMSASSRLDWVALLWLAVSVALLWRLGLNVVLLVLLSAAFGLGRHALSF